MPRTFPPFALAAILLAAGALLPPGGSAFASSGGAGSDTIHTCPFGYVWHPARGQCIKWTSLFRDDKTLRTQGTPGRSPAGGPRAEGAFASRDLAPGHPSGPGPADRSSG